MKITYLIEVESKVYWASPEDFEVELELFNKANKDLVEARIVKIERMERDSG